MDIRPVLYCSNQALVDENLIFMRNRFDAAPEHELYQELSTNRLSGCTMVMNRALREELLKKDRAPSDGTLALRFHDTWCMIVANVVGTVIYDDESRILYRQHSNNVVGAKKLSKRDIVGKKLYRLRSGKYKGARSKIAKEVLEIFHDELSHDNQANLAELAECRSFKGAIRLTRNPRLRPTFSESTPVLFVKALLGWI